MRALADELLVDAVLDDYHSAPIDDRLRAALEFVEALTVDPSALERARVERLRARGVSDQALVDAAHVAAAFAILNKLADAFGWDALSDTAYATRAQSSLDRGYAVPPELLE